MAAPARMQTSLRPDTEFIPRQISGQPGMLHTYYHALYAAHGPQHWWPGRTRFEIIIGAILTQNTSWKNVESAIRKLRRQRLLSVKAIEDAPLPQLARIIRSSGYYRQKAKKLKAFVAFLRSEYAGSLNRMFRAPTEKLRAQLLEINGIGPETADTILLYAGAHAVFVIDAYTRRMLQRHGQAESRHSYDELRSLFEVQLPRDVRLYNEYHALIVRAGKEHCWARDPNCAACPLREFLPKVAPALS